MPEAKSDNEDLFYARTSALESAIATAAACAREEKQEAVRSILLLQIERLCDLQIQTLRQ